MSRRPSTSWRSSASSSATTGSDGARTGASRLEVARPRSIAASTAAARPSASASRQVEFGELPTVDGAGRLQVDAAELRLMARRARQVRSESRGGRLPGRPRRSTAGHAPAGCAAGPRSGRPARTGPASPATCRACRLLGLRAAALLPRRAGSSGPGSPGPRRETPRPAAAPVRSVGPRAGRRPDPPAAAPARRRGASGRCWRRRNRLRALPASRRAASVSPSSRAHSARASSTSPTSLHSRSSAEQRAGLGQSPRRRRGAGRPRSAPATGRAG